MIEVYSMVKVFLVVHAVCRDLVKASWTVKVVKATLQHSYHFQHAQKMYNAKTDWIQRASPSLTNEILQYLTILNAWKTLEKHYIFFKNNLMQLVFLWARQQNDN
jgi:hypothetical protein